MNKTILVIDDDQDILSIIDFVCCQQGYRVTLLNTGTSVEHIRQISPDMILLDVRIAGYQKTGDQICTELRSDALMGSTPILLVSAEPNLHELSESCGASGYLNKPFEIDMLLERIKEFIP